MSKKSVKDHHREIIKEIFVAEKKKGGYNGETPKKEERTESAWLKRKTRRNSKRT